jgi:hypothetical protein
MSKTNLEITCLIILFVSSFSFGIQSIYGHTEIKVGNYTIEAGWAKEPPLLNNLNDIVISVFENDDSPVRNAMKDLSTSINYGGLAKKLNFVPSEQSPGVYMADIIPSKLGTYSLNLKGAIGTQSINNDIQIEDIEDAKKLTFPIVSAENAYNLENIGKQIRPILKDLANQIDESKREINSTNELIQKINKEGNSIKSEIDRSSILSYIATGLSASAIILAVSLREMKIKLRR